MSGNRGCIFNSIMFLVIVFVPVVGHIIETIMVFEDDHTLAGTALWLAIISLPPLLGRDSHDSVSPRVAHRLRLVTAISGKHCLAARAGP